MRICAAGMVETDLAKDLKARMHGIIGEEKTAEYYVSILPCVSMMCCWVRVRMHLLLRVCVQGLGSL